MDIEGKTYKEFPALSKTRFIGCTFHGCSISESISHTRFIDCQFIHCQFSLLELNSVRIQSSTFASCRLIGIDFTRCDTLIFDPDFIDCYLEECTFTALKLNKRTISNSKMIHCRFDESDLSYSNLGGSDFSGTTFHHTNLSHANLVHAVNYKIDPINNRLKGCKFSPAEALSLLEPFEIVLED